MSRMTWEEKFAAICALDGDACVMMRKPGDWYVSWRNDIKEEDGGCCLHHRYGNGSTPEGAVLDHWRCITEEQPLAYVVVRGDYPNRRHVVWNGYMWRDLPISGPGTAA